MALASRGVTREPGALHAHPVLKFRDQRRAPLAAHREATLGSLAVDLALDVEQRVDPLHRLQRQRRDRRRALAAPLVRRDVGELVELAPAMSPAERLDDGSRRAARRIEPIVRESPPLPPRSTTTGDANSLGPSSLPVTSRVSPSASSREAKAWLGSCVRSSYWPALPNDKNLVKLSISVMTPTDAGSGHKFESDRLRYDDRASGSGSSRSKKVRRVNRLESVLHAAATVLARDV